MTRIMESTRVNQLTLENTSDGILSTATKLNQQYVVDDIGAFLDVLPPNVREGLDGDAFEDHHLSGLLEVVIDLGRVPEARFIDGSLLLGEEEVSRWDIETVIAGLGRFGDDNRAGIERTLHRFSVIRDREGNPVGLTCRVGRAVFGSVRLIQDLIQSGRSVLILGRPGIGKTTILREVARVLADDASRRVVIVDTSNEIGGDGAVAHPAIGRARRMQVPNTELQHRTMIEAVENHMPEVVVIDEIGTELEALAARTIAERGVQLVATAHGNTLGNVITNPTLSDLVGGTQAVTLGDIEARRRRTQKTVLERKHTPTFDVVVEMRERNYVGVHIDVGRAVDRMLRGLQVPLEMRQLERRWHRRFQGRRCNGDRRRLRDRRIRLSTPIRSPTTLLRHLRRKHQCTSNGQQSIATNNPTRSNAMPGCLIHHQSAFIRLESRAKP